MLLFPPDSNEFVSYEPAAFMIQQWKNLMAFNAFITWFKIFKYLKFVPFMSHLLKVLGAAFPDAATFLVCFFFVYMGAALAHLLAYGDEVEDYRTSETNQQRDCFSRPPSLHYFLHALPSHSWRLRL